MSELPSGWTDGKLQDCVKVLDNLRVPVNSDERNKRQGNIPYYGATGQVGWIDDYLFDEELLLIGEDGAPFFDKTKPIAYIIRGKSWVNNHAHVLRAISGLTSNLYLKYFLDRFDFHDYVNGTTRLKLTQGSMNEIPVKLAPVNEQGRIVAKLEKLLGRVDAAQARLAVIPDILKRFRQSVLAAACSGRLTVDWREVHPETDSASEALRVHAQRTANRARNTRRLKPAKGLTLIDYSEELPDTWVWLKVRQLVERGAIFDVQDGNHGELYPRADDFGEVGVPYISAENVINDRVQLDSAPRLRHEKAKQLRIGFAKANDVVLTHNATVGRVAVLPSDSPNVVLSTSTTYYRVDDAVLLPSYLATFLRSHYFQSQLETVMEQTTRNQVSVTKQVELGIALPTIAEQQEIVRRVEALFKTADALEARYRKAKAHVDKLTQSILAKAFRGELVPQDPKDEPAVFLLQRMKTNMQERG